MNHKSSNPFLPISQQIVRWNDIAYGIPIALDFQVLYYNQNLVTDPAITVQDLLNQASDGTSFGLSFDFSETIWGITAFNGLVIDENQKVTILEDGFNQWLEWLQSANEIPTITLSQSTTLATSRFRDGESAYLIGAPTLAESLTNQLGGDLQVALLPGSANGQANPLLETEVFYLNPNLVDQSLETVIAFTTLATSSLYQDQLLQQAGRIPTNVNVDISSVPHINEFFRQAQNSLIIINTPENIQLFEAGNELYNDVLSETIPLDDAFNVFLSKAN